jgi:adenylate kinase family enzyme
MKIAICGKMASGKTTMAEELSLYGFRCLSLAGEVKRVGRELFGMKVGEKNRPLLQQIGMKMREIRESVWLEVLIQEAEKYDLVVCDDVRFINEAKTLKENGWLLIKLDISDDLQKKRLQNTYPDDWESHWNNRSDPSEAEVNKIPLEWFDDIIEAKNGTSPFNRLRPRVECYE